MVTILVYEEDLALYMKPFGRSGFDLVGSLEWRWDFTTVDVFEHRFLLGRYYVHRTR